jgi:FkbM family methyltransferase
MSFTKFINCNLKMNFQRVVGPVFAKIFSNSYLITQFARMVVQIYDNDQNSDIRKNGELKLLTHLVTISNNHSQFVDVGANVGDYSTELVKAGLIGKLCLVDPLKRNLLTAQQRLVDLNFYEFELMQFALSDSTGKQIFYTNLDNELSGHDSLYDMRSIGYSENVEPTEVDVKRLDDVMFSSEIHFLKIDVEGNELNVLKGAENLLARGAISFIQFEFGNAAKAARIYLHDIVFFLESKQYKIYIIKPKGLVPLVFTPFTEMRYSYINFVAVHANSVRFISNIIISS